MIAVHSYKNCELRGEIRSDRCGGCACHAQTLSEGVQDEVFIQEKTGRYAVAVRDTPGFKEIGRVREDPLKL